LDFIYLEWKYFHANTTFIRCAVFIDILIDTARKIVISEMFKCSRKHHTVLINFLIYKPSDYKKLFGGSIKTGSVFTSIIT